MNDLSVSVQGLIQDYYFIFRSKVPADAFEAEMLALAGMAAKEDDDSADSVAGDADIWDDTDDEDDKKRRRQEAQPQFNEDMEAEIKGSRTLPKHLPAVSADAGTDLSRP